MATCAMIVDQQGTLSGGIRNAFLFADLDGAKVACEGLIAAIKAYNDRANDREKMFRFESLEGPAALDVTIVAAVAVSDPCSEHREAIDEWMRRQGELRQLTSANPT